MASSTKEVVMPSRLSALLDPFDPDLPLARASTIPASWYLDPEVDELERRAVFGDTWQAIGRADQVAEPGSFFTADVAGEPIVVVRDGEGTLRAFYNVCRHRAARVACAEQGKASKLRCRYHGWTYDLRGRLRGTPEFDGVEGFPREANGLVPVTVDSWGPLVWVHLGASPPPLAEHLAPLVAGWTGSALRWAARRQYDLACNWKVYVDNFLDGGYHVNTVHPGLAEVIDYPRYTTQIAGPTSVQISPLRPAGGEPIERVRGGDAARYWWVFPNLMLNLYQGVLDTNLVLPGGPGACRVIFDFYFADTELVGAAGRSSWGGPDAERFMAESLAVAHQVQMEDAGVCEEVQRGLRSRSYNTGRFSVKREAAGYHFHQLLARKLRHSVAQSASPPVHQSRDGEACAPGQVPD
jgi:choline monooxygenase